VTLVAVKVLLAPSFVVGASLIARRFGDGAPALAEP